MQTQQLARTVVSPARRFAAYAAIVLGVLGILLGLLGVFGVWFGRSYVNGLSTSLTSSVDGGLQRASEQLQSAVDRVAGTRERLQTLQTNAGQLGSGPTGRAAAEQLGAAIDRELGPPLTALREAYAELSARIESGIGVLNTLDRLPGVNVPQLPTEQLQTLDTRSREIDEDLQAIRQSLDEQGLPLSAVGSRIAERIANIDTRVGELESAVEGVQTTVDNSRNTVAQVNATVARVTLWSALGLTLLLLWNALLHWLLLLRGRAWLRGDPHI